MNDIVPLPKTLVPVPGVWRHIYERSTMVNNDEWIVYRESESPCADGGARLMLARPLFQEELDAGLFPGKPKPLMGDDSPKLTYVLDAIFRLRRQLHFWMGLGVVGLTPSTVLAQVIAANYYDCMSGGWSMYAIYACHQLINTGQIDLDTQVYPNGPDSWHTIKDFQQATAATNLRISDLLNERR